VINVPEEQKKVNEEVTILRRRTITTSPKIGVIKTQVAVTYSTPTIPPRTIFILQSEHTPSKERELIKKDIEAQRKKKPETVMV